MKKIYLALITLMLSSSLYAEQAGNHIITDNTSNATPVPVRSIFAHTQTASQQDIDGAVIVTDAVTLEAYVATSIASIEKVAKNEYKVTVTFRNKSDNSVYLANLNNKETLLLIDHEQFAYKTKNGFITENSEIIIPANAAVRGRYVFAGVEGTPAGLQIYGVDIPVKNEPQVQSQVQP